MVHPIIPYAPDKSDTLPTKGNYDFLRSIFENMAYFLTFLQKNVSGKIRLLESRQKEYGFSIAVDDREA